MNDVPEIAKLPSGAELKLCDVPFETAMELLEAAAAEAQSVSIGLKLDVNFATDPAAMARLLAEDLPVDLIKNAVCQFVASSKFKAKLWACMERQLYNGQAVNRQTFENRNARADYLPAAWEVIKFTLIPFFSGLSLKSSTANPPAGNSQR